MYVYIYIYIYILCLVDKFHYTECEQDQKKLNQPFLLTTKVLNDLSKHLIHSLRELLRKLSLKNRLSQTNILRLQTSSNIIFQNNGCILFFFFFFF